MRTITGRDIRMMMGHLREGVTPFVGSGKKKLPLLAPGRRMRHKTGIEYTIDDVVYTDDSNTSIDHVVLIGPAGAIHYIEAKQLKDYTQ
jgi:hypothetical protein